MGNMYECMRSSAQMSENKNLYNNIAFSTKLYTFKEYYGLH